LQVLKHYEYRLETTLAAYEASDGLGGVLPPLRWFQAVEGMIVWKDLKDI